MRLDHDLLDRLTDRVMLMPDGCWQWTGSLVQKGYGQIKQDSKGLRAHRVMYEWMIGPIPDGLHLNHKCRNRGCVNPDHLETVTISENTLHHESQANAAKNLRKTHCIRGHEFTLLNTYWYPGRNKRACRICRGMGTAGAPPAPAASP